MSEGMICMRISEKERVRSTMDRLQYEVAGLVTGKGKLSDLSGGCLAMTTTDGGLIIAGELFGVVPRIEVDRLMAVALEQATRLALHPFSRTSYSSRKPSAEIVDFQGNSQPWGQRGGAVRACLHILSYAGHKFPEKWNEAVVFVLAIKLGWIKPEKALSRISPKRNPHLRPLLEACNTWVEYERGEEGW